MDRAAVVTCVNPKGGVGKTTMAVHLATAFRRMGGDVLLLDLDPQGSAVDWADQAAPGYDGPEVQTCQRELSTVCRDVGADLVMVDAPARLDRETGQVLSSADVALVPVRPSGLDLWGTAEFIDMLTDHTRRGLSAAFVGSQRDVRTTLSEDLDEALSSLDVPMLDGLTLRVSYARSISAGRTVLDGDDHTAIKEVHTLRSQTLELL